MPEKTAPKKHQTVKAQITRASLVVAAAALLRSQGPASVTYRRVAEWADASSSSVGYYFDSINDLLREAADYNIRLWGQRAEKAADEAEAMDTAAACDQCVALLLKACLPEDFTVPAAHYAQLISAAESDVVTEQYRVGRKRLDAAVARILDRAGIERLSPRMVAVIVDGAAVAGISEGYPVREMAEKLLSEAVSAVS